MVPTGNPITRSRIVEQSHGTPVRALSLEKNAVGEVEERRWGLFDADVVKLVVNEVSYYCVTTQALRGRAPCLVRPANRRHMIAKSLTASTSTRDRKAVTPKGK